MTSARDSTPAELGAEAGHLEPEHCMARSGSVECSPVSTSSFAGVRAPLWFPPPASRARIDPGGVRFSEQLGVEFIFLADVTCTVWYFRDGKTIYTARHFAPRGRC